MVVVVTKEPGSPINYICLLKKKIHHYFSVIWCVQCIQQRLSWACARTFILWVSALASPVSPPANDILSAVLIHCLSWIDKLALSTLNGELSSGNASELIFLGLLVSSSCHGVSSSQLHGVCSDGSHSLPSRFTFFMVLQWWVKQWITTKPFWWSNSLLSSSCRLKDADTASLASKHFTS